MSDNMPSDKARSMVGADVHVETNGRDMSGRCIGVERTHTTIRDPNTGEEWPGVRFHVRAPDGRSHWTPTYPDTQ